MAAFELQLISRIVRTGDLNSVLNWGITENDFISLQGKGLWRALCTYHSMPDTVGAILGPGTVQEKFPNFVLMDDGTMTTEALCVELRKQRLSLECKNFVQSCLQVVDGNPMQAISMLQSGMTSLQNLGLSKKTDVNFYDGFSQRLRRYELIKAKVDLSCCPWPWEPLQSATLGIQPDDYIVFYGRPKSMKTWVLAFLIAWFFEKKKRILIYTKEMTPDNIFWRAGACLAEVRYGELNTADLSWEEEQSLYAVERMLRVMQAVQTVVCLSGADASEGGDTVPWLKAKVEQYKPDAVFIDGMYLMSDAMGAKKDNERVRNISRAIRQMNLSHRVPVIATLQANRAAANNESANLDEIAFSDAIGQDATLICRAINEKDKPTIALVIGGSREYKLNGLRIYGVPAVNFEYAGPISMGEILEAQEADVDDGVEPVEEQKDKGTKGKKTRKKKKKEGDVAEANAATEAVERMSDMIDKKK